MREMKEEYEEYDEIPEEHLEEVEENPEEVLEKITLEEMGIEKEWWNESMKEIDIREIQEKEIEGAKEIIEEEKELELKLESGEISKSRYDHEKLVVLGHKKAAFSMRTDLESKGLTYDHLGDVAEDMDFEIAEAAGNPKPARGKEGVKKLIYQEGPEYAQELADRMLKEEKISEQTHETISRQVRLHGK